MRRRIVHHIAYESWVSWAVSRLLGDPSGERIGAWVEHRWITTTTTAGEQS